MLLVAAGATQALLLCDLLLRRILFLFLPGRRSGLKRFADNAALTSFAAALLQTATLPVLAVASVVNTLGRSLSLIALSFVVFGGLLVMSTSAVYAYTVLARIYNVGVAPVVMATQWLFVLLDFVFRAVVPLYNGAAFMSAEILRRLVLPYSFHNIETLPEILQGVSLALVSLGLSVTSWLKNVMECTVLYESAGRFCGVVANTTALKLDCAGIFTAVHTQCFAAPNHLTVDLLTPGLFARQAMLSLRRVIASNCGVAALVLNLLLFPLADHRLYAAVHAGVNTALFGVIGLPVTTVRRCEALKLARAGDRASAGDLRAGLSRAHELVACTPDWEPLMLMASSTLDSVGEVIDGWLNAAALLARDRIGAESNDGASRCNEAVRMSSIVLDAARAIEGHESIEALERLQIKGGLPDGETLMRVRVAGLTPKLFGVTDGKAVLYRSAHDGYVWAFGAWPFSVDVRLGLAAVSYSGSATETDATGDARTGLLGCRCVKDGGFKLLCATAPYVAHVDDGLASLNASAVHVVSFPELSLLGMSCDNTAVRVLPLRWPRRRLATAEGNGGSGYAGYQRFSYLNTAQRLKGDTDATDNLRLLAHKYAATQAGAVEAAVFVQPLCGGGFNPACWRAAKNCYPWCMGVVRGGVRAQNITMYSAQRWEDHVMLPDVDCGVQRAREQIVSGECVREGAASAIVDIMSQEGVVYGECRAARMCTPSPVPASVMSLVPLLNRDARLNGTELGLVVEHKNSTWLTVRTQEQPFVVAGDVMLGVTQDDLGKPEAVVVTRLYDIGHGSLQMGSERLTLTSNFHAIQIAQCDTLADASCYANSMARGKIVLPQSVYQVYTNEDRLHADGGEPPGLLPAAASRWAVHWADNPDLAVYRVRFKFCNGDPAAFGINVRSSFGRARVWTVQTMRGVDMESAGEPSEEEVRSRVSYMRVPEFYGDFFAEEDGSLDQCGVVVGIKIVSVEYLNPQNVLVTVLAARPRDYDPDTDTVDGPRTYRYYFLHPSRHDCRDVDEQEAVDGERNIFSCWRTHDKGMWPDDGMLAGGSWGATPPDQALLATGDAPCTEARLVPAFGSALVVPLSAVLSLVQTVLDAVCTLTAAVAANPTNPLQAVRDLHTIDLERATFHSMTDSAGARLLRVDDIIAALAWCARFNAHLMIYVVNAFSSVTSTLASSKMADKTLSGLRTVVVGAAKVAEGGPGALPAFQGVEAMFEQPIVFSSVYASTAVLGMADGLQQDMRLPSFVSVFVRAQAGMVGSLSFVLRLGRVVLLRVLQTGGSSPAAVASSALLESQAIVKADLLDTMRFQCYGLAQMVGATQTWGQALRHLCLLFPDTIEGVMTVVTVLVLDYPTVSCACKLSDGEMRSRSDSTVLDAVTRICLLRPLPIEETQWLAALAMHQEDKRQICFITMDRANARLSSAFDKAYLRLRHMTEYIEGVVDGLLALVTGDSVDCDAFDVSPYVVSIIPEPVDYFTACVDTEDCRVKCLEEYSAFDSAKQFEEFRGMELGLQTDVSVDLESMLFSAQDIEDGKNKPPFMILDMAEIPRRSCAQVCGGTYNLGNRCLVLAGLRTVDSAQGTQKRLAIAYYCLPIDVTQYAFQWPGMEAETVQVTDSPAGYPSLSPADVVRSVHVASSWGPQFGTRDMLLVVVRSPDDSFADQTDLLDEGVTKVQLVVAGQPTPFEVMRTSMRSERLQQVGVTRTAKDGFLHKIDHLQVNIADNRRNFIAVEARGYVMELKTMQDTELQSWELPRKACVRCEISFEGSDFLPIILCTTACINEQTGKDDTELDFVLQHKRMCVRALGAEEDETPNALQVCEEHIALSSMSKVEKALYLQTVSSGKSTQSKMSIPDSLLSLLRVDAIARSYSDVDNKIHTRTTLLARVVYLEPRIMDRLRALAGNESAVAESRAETVLLEIPTANARDVHGGWLHILNLKVSESAVSGRMRTGMQTSTVSHVFMNCSVHNCGACVRRGNGELDEDLFSLQNMCYAAQQCGIERCAGTLVNMRKPLCNLGKVLSAELHGMRVLLKGVWTVITDKITMTVELTHQRREEYEMRWPDTALRQQTCTAKDTIVSMAATMTSVLGAVSHLMRDVSQQNSIFGSHVDSRVHARQIMTLTATTNLLTSVMLYPVYQTIVFQKFISCTASDVSYSISELVATAQERGQPELTINFGGRMQEAAERAQIAVCLSEDVRQSLVDTGSRIQDINSQQASNKPRDARKITRLITDAISSTIDVTLRSYVQYATHVLDIYLTWTSGIIKGMMDVAQTVDWERCKLPVVDNGLESLGQCACGDEAYSIPVEEQRRDWSSQGFWCSGLLMLNEGDGSDLLVWNPFSLQELLNMQGSRDFPRADESDAQFWDMGDSRFRGGRYFKRRLMQSQGDFDEYVDCLRGQHAPVECEPYKPRDNRLSQQGVEVMQVISRCRENYQQRRWDEAATLYALFTVEEWRSGNLRNSASMQADDKFTLLRKKVVKLVENDRQFWTSSQSVVDISPGSWVCLADALAAGNLRHNCHIEAGLAFAYVRATNNLPTSVDACRVPENITDRPFPRFLWTGSSTNHIPLTKLHVMNIPQNEREKIAQDKIEKMIEDEIKPTVERMMESSFTAALKEQIDVEAFSVEGDELHQLIDCIVLGPYAAASLSANVHLENLPPLPVPLYHRGSALSRKFSSWGPTGGSPARKAFMHIVRRHVETRVTETVTNEVKTHMQDITKIWLDKRNFFCTCPKDPVPQIKCCVGLRRENLDFGVQNAFGRRNWEISHQIVTAAFEDISQSNTINRKWLEQIGEPVLLNENQRSIVSAAQLFAPAGNVPVHTYGTEDSLALLNNESLWEWCTSRVTGLFATMPLTGEEINKKYGRGSKSSIPDVPLDESGDPYQYDPARDRDDAPARDHHDARNHAMELVVDKLLARSRAFAPHFWTHAHRYVASDSVWCEGGEHRGTAAPEIRTPSSINTQALRQESVLAPDIDQLLYPADVLQACACGWEEAEGACYIPAEVCLNASQTLTASDARLADGRLMREVWASLCEGRVAATDTAPTPASESTSYDSTSNACPAGMRVEFLQLDNSSSCSAFMVGTGSGDITETNSQLCNCHKFADKIILVGGVDGYPRGLLCKWVVAADANITINVNLNVRSGLTSRDVFYVLRTSTGADINTAFDQISNEQVVFDSAAKSVIQLQVTERDYVEILFQASASSLSTVNKVVNASWSLAEKDNLSKNGNVRCVPCDAGKYSVASDAGCLQCERGKFSPTAGASACFDCPVGSYQPSTGQTTCLSGTTYMLHTDLLVVLQVLQALDAAVLKNCSARRLSIAWGLLAPEQAEAWYAGESASEQPGGSWSVSAQHLATEGSGGLRLGMLSPNAPQTMQDYVSEFELGERAGGLFNAYYNHTIAQPVCNATLHKLLREELDEYFVNALLPMAHSVQIVPAVEYCVRWTIEYALLSVLRLLLQETQESDQDTRDRFLLLVSRQQTAANVWRDRCSTQAQDVALCTLRGVYDIVPESNREPPQSCAFAGHQVSQCRQLYYTSACLLYCDGVFYDPCMCESQRKDSECSARDFSPSTCTAGKIVDGRRLFTDLSKTEDLLTNSLHWPSDILPGEARDSEHEEQLLDALQGVLAVAKHDVDLLAVFESATVLLLEREDEENVPQSYCDDLLDYWPDVQHPVGYHPTSACSASDTRTRGFGSWMSETLNGSDTLIDLVRMRNMTAASQVFGAANLVCDAHTYAAPGHRLNPYYMQSKWNLKAPADPSIPRRAPRLGKEDMNFPGLPSFEETDTTLRRQGHASDSLLQHSVGLVRSWARWYPPTNAHGASNAGGLDDPQALLDHVWPHWLQQTTAATVNTVEVTGYFLTDSGNNEPAGCGFPELDVCTSDQECEYGRNRNSAKLVCLKNFDTEGVSQTGVCMQIGTCFQHHHCANSSSDSETLCSGEGRCVPPMIRVRNEASINAEVQLFAARECDVSMQRLSLFESVPDFAEANGMCSFRNWYHYRNATDDTPGFQYIKEVPDGLVFRTDEAEARTLSDLDVLRHTPHACDRSYSHTEYKACYAQDYRARLETPEGTRLVKSVDITRTWVHRGSEWHARFCNLKGGGDVTGFLNPYKQTSQTLHSAPQDIRRCADFKLCPTLLFHIRGQGVEKRRVRVYEKSVDSPFGVQARTTVARDYCALDAQRCWGAGYMLGSDCADVNREESNLCIPDRLVLPLVTIVFGDETSMSEEEANTKLLALRQNCVNAFGEGLSDSGLRGQALFIDVQEHLATPYKWTDTERLRKVNRYANGLLWFVFGMDAEGRSDKRGFGDVDTYIQHSDCLVYLAKKLLENEQVIDQQVNAQADLYSSSYEQRVVPGASLYIFERRVPVEISFRWFTQCVVLANANEGGVSARFLAHMIDGEHGKSDTVQCDNYQKGLEYMKHIDETPVPLKKWLQTAPFLFEQMDFVDSDSEIKTAKLHATQISRDVINTISWAVGQLPVFDIPDLVCISAVDNDLVGRLNGQKNIIDSELERHQNPGVVFDKPGLFLTMLTESKNMSIYKQVLDYLTNGNIDWDVGNPTMSLQALIDANVIEDLHKNVLSEVTPNDVFPMYDYVRLRSSEMLSLYRSFTESRFSEEDYLYDTTMSADCKCAASKKQECRRLKKPEYSLHTPMRCSYSKILPCSDPVKYLLDERAPEDNTCVDEKKPCQFLQQQELLYLVLLILDKEITNTVSGGFMALHKIREPDESRAVDVLFQDALSNGLPYLSLSQAKQFNAFVEERSVMNLKCPEKEFSYQKLTNQMHKTMQSCRTDLKDPVGWNVPPHNSGTLALHPKVNSLLHGFYPAFLLRDRDANRTFLDDLLFTDWHLEAHGHKFIRSICYEEDDEVSVIAPFWAEFFDVATNFGREDSASDPPIACDMKRSGTDNRLMFYNTLCAANAEGVQSCAQHPVYENYVKNVLPAVCEKRHGQSVVRSHIGALDGTPLCEKIPPMPDICSFKHGALFGHAGEAVPDLDGGTSPEAVAVQSGLWDKNNFIFRGRYAPMTTGRVPALKLRPQDIGGHCLEFAISPSAYLYLDKVLLTSNCRQDGGRVRDWLQNIEQDWAWEHSLAQKLLVAQEASESSRPSWRCPLHWLGQFHDDESRHQARGPSWRRNRERFAHITGPFPFAHPTIRNAYRLRGVRAASFVSDTLACVAADSGDCHNKQYLSDTLERILSKEEWHVVQYVTNRPDLECDRVLDWPSDCGSSTQTGLPGACNVRQ